MDKKRIEKIIFKDGDVMHCDGVDYLVAFNGLQVVVENSHTGIYQLYNDVKEVVVL